MIRGLSLHYLNLGSVEEAIEIGRAAGVPTDLLETLPGMMFQITSAAGAIASGERKFEDVLDELMERVSASKNADGFNRNDAAALLKITLEFFDGLGGNEDSLPTLAVPWYLYGKQNSNNL